MKASVAYEAPRSAKPLKWHIAGEGLEAEGARGAYRIERQKPNRRKGEFRWALTMAGASEVIKSLDDREALKAWADKYDRAAATPPGPLGDDKARGAAPSATYKKRVHDALVKLGSPTPEADIDKSEGFLKGKEGAGVDPLTVAAMIEATLHHGHHHIVPSKTADFALENRAREAPTREEWEVIVTNPPAAHRGAIMSMVGPGEAEAIGNRLLLRGFHDDSEASNVATSIAKRYRVQVTFGPRNPLYEAAEGGAKETRSLTRYRRYESKASGQQVYIRSTMDGQVFFTLVPSGEHGNMPLVEFERLYRPVESTEANEAPAMRTESEGIDEHAVTELELFANNESKLYRDKEAILANLQKKRAAGKYDHDKAVKLWMYWVDAAAKLYVKEFGSGSWHHMFPIEVRRQVARNIEQSEFAELEIEHPLV